MVLPVQVERPHGGGIPRAGGVGEAEGPGGLRRAEGAPGPAAHGGLDSTALRRRWLMLGVLAMSRRGFKGGGGAERSGAGRAAATWPELGRGKGVLSSLFRAGETEPKPGALPSPPVSLGVLGGAS